MSKTETITLLNQKNGSDKAYIVILEWSDGGYVVNYRNGKRTNINQGGTKTLKPVDYATAKSVFDATVKKKMKDGYDPVENAADISSIQLPDPGQKKSGLKVGCKLLTEIATINHTVEAIVEAAQKLLVNDNYAGQKKWDGHRLIAHATAKRATGYNRKEQPRSFPSVIAQELKAFAALVGPALLDGELIGDKYIVFDVLEWGGDDYRQSTYDERQTVLAEIFKAAASVLKAVRYDPPSFGQKNKTALLLRLIEEKAEGIVFLKRDSMYEAKRDPLQFKLKFTKTASFVVIKLNDKDSVEIGVYDGDKLVSCGNVKVRNATFRTTMKVGAVVECKYLYAHRGSNNVSQARMLMTRDDIDPADCQISQLVYKVEEE